MVFERGTPAGQMLRILGESFARFAVNSVNGKDRREKPQRLKKDSPAIVSFRELCIADVPIPCSLVPQMSAGEADENVFQARLPCRQMLELAALLVDCFEQRRDREVRLFYV